MTMHRWILLLALGGALSAPAIAEQNAADRELAKQLAMQLKSELMQALQVSPEHAIAVCNERAPEIASKIGAAHDVQIGRTALRVRNPANQPTPWQREVLDNFIARAAAGEPLATMEYSAIVREQGVAERRYMKPIVTEALCVTCHGQQVGAAVKNAIAAKYPTDAATGFSIGDLRGAVYVVRRLQEPSQK